MEHIILEIKNRIATITINRAKQYNTLTTPVFNEISDALEECDKNQDLSAIIITGSGKAFSAGGDISEFNSNILKGIYLDDALIGSAGRLALTIRKISLPVIAMVNGSAAGAGLGLALACDFRVLSKKAKLVTAFTDVAAPGDTCTLYFLGKMIGTSKLSQYAYLSDAITAEEAFDLGIAYKVVEPEELEATAYSLAEKLSNKPKAAMAKQKEYINKFLYTDINNVVTFERHAMTACSRLPEFTEAINAFLEKRQPVFENKTMLVKNY